MKKQILALMLALPLTLIAANKSIASTAELWEGPGTLFDAQGKESGKYFLVVENINNGSQTQSNVTVTLQDGTTQKHQCSITKKSRDGWLSVCDNGDGGGRCFGEGLCISYVENATGRAYATTMVLDGPSDMRLLRTELQNGQAVRFFREKLHKR